MSFKDILKATNLKEFKAAVKGVPVEMGAPVVVDRNVDFTPELPRINAVPLEVIEKYRFKGIARKYALMGIGVAGVFVLAYAGGLGYMAVGNAELDKISQDQAAMQAEVDQLQPYDTYRAAVDNKRKTLFSQVEQDVNMGEIYSNINSSSSNNTIDVDRLNVTQSLSGDVDSSCINPNPFGDNAGIIGCVSVAGVGPNKDAVNGFLDELETMNGANPAYKNPFISSFTSTNDNGRQISNFAATISFTTELYSNQYKSLALELAEVIKATAGETPVEPVEEEPITPPVEEPVEEEIIPAGFTSTQAKLLIPELTEADALTLDGLAVSICETPEEQRADIFTNSTESIRTLLTTNYPDIEADTITETIMTTIITAENCEAILATSSQENDDSTQSDIEGQ